MRPTLQHGQRAGPGRVRATVSRVGPAPLGHSPDQAGVTGRRGGSVRLTRVRGVSAEPSYVADLNFYSNMRARTGSMAALTGYRKPESRGLPEASPTVPEVTSPTRPPRAEIGVSAELCSRRRLQGRIHSGFFQHLESGRGDGPSLHLESAPVTGPLTLLSRPCDCTGHPTTPPHPT